MLVRCAAGDAFNKQPESTVNTIRSILNILKNHPWNETKKLFSSVTTGGQVRISVLLTSNEIQCIKSINALKGHKWVQQTAMKATGRAVDEYYVLE